MSASFNGRQLFSITQEGGKQTVSSAICVYVCVWERVCVWCGVYSVESCLLCGLATKLSPSRSHTRSPEAVYACLLRASVYACMSSWRRVGVDSTRDAFLWIFGALCSSHRCPVDTCAHRHIEPNTDTHTHTHTHTHIYGDSRHKHTTKSSIIFRYFPMHTTPDMCTPMYIHTKTHCSCFFPSGFISVFVSVSHTLNSSSIQQL